MAKKQAPVLMGAPEWVLTFGDMMSLLLCFFVIIVSMSEVRKDTKSAAVVASIRTAFGGLDGSLSPGILTMVPTNRLIDLLEELEIQVHTNNPSVVDDEGVEGRKMRVTSVRDGIEVTIGGTITFERFSATLQPEGQALVERTAALLAGYNTKLLVRGHATREPLPEDSIYASQLDLSYERAKAVARVMMDAGVDRARLVIVALGDTEPLKRQVYTEDRLAANRRVEILVTEDVPEDFAGSTEADDNKEPSDG